MKLPVTIDGTLSASDLAPSPTELMLAAGGIEFENSADAAAAYPQLWATPDAARQAAYRRCVTNPNKKTLYNGLSRTSVQKASILRRVDYQITGRGRRREVAWIDPALVPDPAAALTEKLGPLAWYSAAEQPIIASAATQSAAIPGPVSDGAPDPSRCPSPSSWRRPECRRRPAGRRPSGATSFDNFLGEHQSEQWCHHGRRRYPGAGDL